MYTFSFKSNAKTDAEDAYEWYFLRSPSSATEFDEAVDEALERIKSNPHQYALIGKGVRRCLLKRFPFSIVYSIQEQEIVVIAIPHVKRARSSWRKHWKS